MRKKIAKRRRRECLRRGLVVTKFKHYQEHDGSINVLLDATYKGHAMSCFAYDDLEAWQMARDIMDFTDEMEVDDGQR